jgi:ABC-type transporter Mla subunit MlaD
MAETTQADGADTLGTKASAAAQSVKQDAADLAERQKKSGADQLSGIAGAVHAAASELEQQLPGAAGYVHDAATRLDDAASGLRNRSLSDLMEDIRRLGQERPMALFGGAVVAGFALSRFLKSATGSTRHTDRHTGA